MIPKIIHQLWNTSDIPDMAIPWVESWKEFNPEWEYRLWTDEDKERLCKERFPDLWEMYQNYPFDIQRNDAIRYMILSVYGGLYADIDSKCFRNIDPLLENVSVGLFKRFGIVTNYLMACEYQSLFFRKVVDSLKESSSVNYDATNKISSVFRTTGLLFLYNCYIGYDNRFDLLSETGYAFHCGGMPSWNRGNTQ